MEYLDTVGKATYRDNTIDDLGFFCISMVNCAAESVTTWRPKSAVRALQKYEMCACAYNCKYQPKEIIRHSLTMRKVV
jgi:hypothetical protein